MPEPPNPRSTGATLKILPGGLEIVRYPKHDPIDLSGLSKKELAERTNKENGSKFLADWTLAACTTWIEGRIADLGWTADGSQCTEKFLLNKPVGIVSGKKVRTILLKSDGRYVHAFPVED